MGYSVAGMYIVVMVHGRWIRVVWATSCRCEFPPRLVAGLAVTQETESVLSRALEESGSTLYDKKEFLCVCPANVV